jgi:PD-(D/E)XK endonuclease
MARMTTTHPVRQCLYCGKVLVVPARRGRGRPSPYCGQPCLHAAASARMGESNDTLPVSSNHKGNIALGSAVAYFASHGYYVFLPVGDNGGAIDVIVSVDGVHTERVQCKYTTAMLKSGSAVYGVMLGTTYRRKTGVIRTKSSVIRYAEQSFDLLFVQTPRHIFLIPWERLWGLYAGRIPFRLHLGPKMTPYIITDFFIGKKSTLHEVTKDGKSHEELGTHCATIGTNSR